MSFRRHVSTLLLPLLLGAVLAGGLLFYFAWSQQVRRATKETLYAAASAAVLSSTEDSLPTAMSVSPIDQIFRMTRDGDQWQVKVLFGEAPDPSDIDVLIEGLGVSPEVFWNQPPGTVTAVLPLSGTSSHWIAARALDTSIYQQKNAAIGLIVIVGSVLLGLLAFLVWHLSKKVTEPIERLKTSAMVLAAGDYDQPVSVGGPSEVVALGNAFNILRVCLRDQVQGIRERSVARELRQGEYEGCQLLLEHMIETPAKSCLDHGFEATCLQLRSGTSLRGVLFSVEEHEEGPKVLINQADRDGLEGIYRLVHRQSSGASMSLQLPHTGGLIVHHNALPSPLVWSVKRRCFLAHREGFYDVLKGDYVIVPNSAFEELWEGSDVLHRWFEKVLRHFAESGLNAVTSMLNQELIFLAHRHHIASDILLLCLRL